MYLLRGHEAYNAVAHKISELLLPRLDYLIHRVECLRILLFERDLLSRQAAPSLIQRKFESCGEAYACSGCPLKCLARVRHHAAAVVPVSCILRSVSEVGQHLIACPVTVDRRESASGGNELGDCLHEFRRAVRVYPAAQRRLMGHALPCCLDGHV